MANHLAGLKYHVDQGIPCRPTNYYYYYETVFITGKGHQRSNHTVPV